MDFDIVIATRNRQSALRLSVPLMLSQSRLPRQLIVVDASDDHASVRAVMESIFDEADAGPIRLRILRADPGTAHQRNIGLRYVTSPVVFFPDDDALWFPESARQVMEMYERDEQGLIGGVAPAESSVPPPGVLDWKRARSGMELRDRLQLSIGGTLDSLEDRVFPDPLFIEALARRRSTSATVGTKDGEARYASLFPGFRMSFRTEAIRTSGFDTTLGRYALFEDYDACLGVLKRYVLVDALTAGAFHFRAPEKRVNGMEWGVIQVLNRAYVVCKHAPPGSAARSRLVAFSCYKTARYLLQAETRYGRQRVRGAVRALPFVRDCLAAPPSQLKECYLKLRTRCLS